MAYLTLPQAAIRINRSEQQVLQLVRDKTVPARMVGRAWLIDEADLERYLQEQRDRDKPRA